MCFYYINIILIQLCNKKLNFPLFLQFNLQGPARALLDQQLGASQDILQVLVESETSETLLISCAYFIFLYKAIYVKSFCNLPFDERARRKEKGAYSHEENAWSRCKSSSTTNFCIEKFSKMYIFSPIYGSFCRIDIRPLMIINFQFIYQSPCC